MAAKFPSSCSPVAGATRFVPGIGATSTPCASSQASAICAGVAPASAVLADEARVGLAPVVIGNVCGGTDLAGQETMGQRRIAPGRHPARAAARPGLLRPYAGVTTPDFGVPIAARWDHFPMGQDDSEKRVAEWQRHVAEQGASPGGWERLKTRLAAVAAVGLLLITSGYVAYELVAYYAGTPTTATIHECIRGRGNTQDCTVSWGVGGQSHTGTINVDHYYPPRSSRGVRVFAGEAHAAPPPSVMLILLGVIAACAVVGAVVPVVW